MALVQRGGCTFYLRSVRRGGRVTSEYVGSGKLAWLFDARVQDAKHERKPDGESGPPGWPGGIEWREPSKPMGP